MTWFETGALGLLQGLTEFLPVSSSGHLALLERFFGIREPQTLYDLSLHLGTLFAVLVYFRGVLRDVAAGVAAWAWSRARGAAPEVSQSDAARLAGAVVIATIPTGLIGVALGDRMEAWSSKPAVTGALLILNGLILGSTRWLRPRTTTALAGFSWARAFRVGVAQGVAILRGVSRSGSTIVAGTVLGLGPKDAARFSFLLFVPAVLGGFVLEARHGWPSGAEVAAPQAVVGALVAFGVGLAALKALMSILASSRLHWFGPYCIAVGALALIAG